MQQRAFKHIANLGPEPCRANFLWGGWAANIQIVVGLRTTPEVRANVYHTGEQLPLKAKVVANSS